MENSATKPQKTGGVVKRTRNWRPTAETRERAADVSFQLFIACRYTATVNSPRGITPHQDRGRVAHYDSQSQTSNRRSRTVAPIFLQVSNTDRATPLFGPEGALPICTNAGDRRLLNAPRRPVEVDLHTPVYLSVGSPQPIPLFACKRARGAQRAIKIFAYCTINSGFLERPLWRRTLSAPQYPRHQKRQPPSRGNRPVLWSFPTATATLQACGTSRPGASDDFRRMPIGYDCTWAWTESCSAHAS